MPLLAGFLLVASLLVAPRPGAAATADETFLDGLRQQRFIQIPGVEPILRPTMPGGGGAYIEMGDIIRDFDTYYLYFHGAGLGGHGGYSIGVASGESIVTPLLPPSTLMTDDPHAAPALSAEPTGTVEDARRQPDPVPDRGLGG
jgi:hypothetical protein